MAKGCGDCTLCCTIFGVPSIDKPTHSRCSSICKSGCSVYQDRPKECREFECLWLQSQTRDKPMLPKLRPDRCGVIMQSGTRPDGVFFLTVHGTYQKTPKDLTPLLKSFIEGVSLRRGINVLFVMPDRAFLMEAGAKAWKSMEKGPDGWVVKHVNKYPETDRRLSTKATID